MDIWGECKKKFSFIELSGDVYRLVESQEQIATNNIVENLEQQALLEQMLENSKSTLSSELHSLHYLLYTPFRYPPLQYGSRFGSRFEPGLFYGSRQINTVLTESAYYRFVFWFGMSEPPPSNKLKTQHMIFAANFRSEKGLQLQFLPFDKFFTLLTDPVNYSHTQKLGSQMRAVGVDVFEYRCARCADVKINLAIFNPRIFTSKQPHDQQQWLCETTSSNISYYHPQSGQVVNFALSQFLLEGKLPQPAV